MRCWLCCIILWVLSMFWMFGGSVVPGPKVYVVFSPGRRRSPFLSMKSWIQCGGICFLWVAIWRACRAITYLGIWSFGISWCMARRVMMLALSMMWLGCTAVTRGVLKCCFGVFCWFCAWYWGSMSSWGSMKLAR